MRRDYIITFSVMVAAMVTTFLIYRLAQLLFGSQGFAEFSFAKRIVAFLVPTLSLGIGVGIPREVARVHGTAEEGDQFIILRSANILILILLLALMAACFFFPIIVSKLLFSDGKYSYLLLPIIICLSGAMFNGIAFAYYRGLNQFVIANILQVCNLVLLPILTIYYLCHDIASYLIVWGSAVTIASLAVTSPFLFTRKGSWWNSKVIYRFILYSVRRVPGDISLELMFVIPPIIAAHLTDFQTAGDVAFSLTLLTLVIAPLSPVSILLLPKIMGLVREQKKTRIKALVNDGLPYVIGIFMAGSIFLFILIGPLISVFLAQKGDMNLFIIKAVILTIVPYSIYVYLRSFIDALSDKAYNSLNCIVSLLAFTTVVLFCGWCVSPMFAIASGIVSGLYTLGIMTFLRVRQSVLLIEDQVSC